MEWELHESVGNISKYQTKTLTCNSRFAVAEQVCAWHAPPAPVPPAALPEWEFTCGGSIQCSHTLQRFVFIGNELKDTEVSCLRDGFLHLALNAVVAIVRPCGVGVPGPPGYGDIGGGGAIGLIMSDGSRGFPFTRMKPPGAAAAVKPLAEGIILRERRKGTAVYYTIL